MVARRYGTVQHNETAAAIDYIDAAREQGRIFGEPFGDQSSVPTHRVSALARRHATVAISGDGGDEVFAGYRRYRWHSLVDAARGVLPASVRRRVVGPLARLYPKLDRAPQWLRAKHTLTELSLDSAIGYYRTIARVQDEQRRALFSAELDGALDGYDPSARIPALMEESGSDDPLVQAQYVDINTWLVGDILTKVDRASMANSLEVRAPLLDYELVEWGLSLPAALKLRGGTGKYVLKRALEPLLPKELLYRRKQGFAMSLGTLFRQEQYRLRNRLDSALMLDSGLFDRGAIRRCLDEHATGQFDHSLVLWHLLVFEGFLASEIGGEVPPERTLDAAGLSAMAATEAQDQWVCRVLGADLSRDGGLAERWQAARDAYQASLVLADAQLAALARELQASEDDDLEEIGASQLDTLTEANRAAVLAAIRSIGAGEAAALRAGAPAVLAAVEAFRQQLDDDRRIAACDANPFGVRVAIRATLAGALVALGEAARGGLGG